MFAGAYYYGPKSEWAGDRYEGDWKDNNKHEKGKKILKMEIN